MFKRISLALLLATPFVFAQSPPQKKRPPQVTYAITKGKVLKMVRPVYPSEARKKGSVGMVSVDAIIDRQGAVKVVRVVKGDRALANAVVDAVSQWRWEPYKLNGEPVEVETTITVNFEPR